MDARSYSKSVDDAIAGTAATAGMDPAYWRAIASIESSLNPSSNYNRPTQFKGLFQLGHPVWQEHGRGNIYDPNDNATAAAAFTRANAGIFRKQFGRDPSPVETYLMHQQGPGFYTKGTMTNIEGNLPEPDRIPENMTHRGFENYWARKIEARAKGFGGEAGNFPPSVAGRYGGSTPLPTARPSAAGVATAAAAPEAPDSTEQGSDATAGFKAVMDRVAKEQEVGIPQMQSLQMQ
jgi:hypothetical protein